MADAVTISLLPVPLALVHVPRSRLQSLSHPVLRHILNPNPVFFTVTANEIELSLFVDYEHVADFDIIACQDRQSLLEDPIEISHEPWSVLQIDSHSDQLDNSGARVNELSAPLAAAGISILYQSSYMSDFIFVKQSRLHESLALFKAAGFDLYTSNTPQTPTLSPPLSFSPISGGHGSTVSSPTIFTRSQFTFSTTTSPNNNNNSSAAATPSSSCPTTPQYRKKKPSHSPSSGEVRILIPDLACVGLSDELGVDHWGLKIVKLVAFPELIPSPPTSSPSISSPSSSSSPPRSDTTRFKEDPSFMPFSPMERRRSPTTTTTTTRESHYRTSEDNGDDDTEDGGEEEDDDGYFSHSPHSVSTAELGFAPEQTTAAVATTTATTTTTAAAVAVTDSTTPPFCHNDILSTTRDFGVIGGLPPINTDITPALPHTPLLPTPEEEEEFEGEAEEPKEEEEEREMTSPLPTPLQIPFFSFTRTQEGSSLTTDVKTLAALFPPEERHLLVCCGDLDLHRSYLDEGCCEFGSDDGQEGEEEEEEEGGDGDVDSGCDVGIGELKCLQIDLRSFGLDKYGLVNRFSKVLGKNGVNHLYSSTFKTANLLVNKKHAVRAQALLRGC